MMRTKKEFEKHFRKEVLPKIRKYEQGKIDEPRRREAWNNMIDTMVMERHLPKRALTWTCPW